MPSGLQLSFLLLGEQSLLVQCAELLRSRGHHVVGVVTRSRQNRAWANGNAIPCHDRFEQLQATGAPTIITACPFCSIMLKGAQASANATTEVVDLMSFVDGRMKSAAAAALPPDARPTPPPTP